MIYKGYLLYNKNGKPELLSDLCRLGCKVVGHVHDSDDTLVLFCSKKRKRFVSKLIKNKTDTGADMWGRVYRKKFIIEEPKY